MSDRIREKLQILADAAKYDVSCSSSGSDRKNKDKGLGDASRAGICHSYTEDGRCVSLLKILFSNVCIFDCAYCVTPVSSSTSRIAVSSMVSFFSVPPFGKSHLPFRKIKSTSPSLL